MLSPGGLGRAVLQKGGERAVVKHDGKGEVVRGLFQSLSLGGIAHALRFFVSHFLLRNSGGGGAPGHSSSLAETADAQKHSQRPKLNRYGTSTGHTKSSGGRKPWETRAGTQAKYPEEHRRPGGANKWRKKTLSGFLTSL